jgi:5-methylcytosine-specific restriction protein B
VLPTPSGTPTSLPDEDEVYQEVLGALEDQFGGVILVGPPGTSKSWYAHQIALKLTEGDEGRIRKLQFHPSYQYDDFIEGYVPTEKGTFTYEPKHLLVLNGKAGKDRDRKYVLIIDELSRTDPARVFGEALTYVEQSKRDEKFNVASGKEISLAPNLVILATMNRFDRGVDDVDAAFDRRMATVDLKPNVAVVRSFLAAAGMEPGLLEKVVAFFEWVQSLPEERLHIGHTYFMGIKDRAGLQRRWNLQLRHFFKKAYGQNGKGYANAETAFNKVLAEDDAAVTTTTPAS